MTNEEAARPQEILRIYNEAWDATRFGAGEDRISASAWASITPNNENM